MVRAFAVALNSGVCSRFCPWTVLALGIWLVVGHVSFLLYTSFSLTPLQFHALALLMGGVEVQPCAMFGAGGKPCLGACL